ncbi:hypothetical protein [Colwellia psychrerythraea]|uniref:DinB family protein n=1 Tax=Colwellia psychrerythraea (strain 34H / ATCC BAA-681) TaxID=167879 RepID=Q488H0_COLP3|nr:hypothetical protein [Colwellia psychrerythraea]AAZ26729.1 hypothetical protein CPS_0796 [Colwellia psychrerythraea 34H]
MITSQLEIIKQGQRYLNTVSKKDYSAIMSPNFMSSAGSHMRHIIDHYLAIMSGLHNEVIDYDSRVRGGQLESSPQLAIDKLNEISMWLKSLCEDELSKMIILSTEVSVTHKNVKKVKTSVARELVFAGSHAVHHYAMITQISFAQQSTLQTKALPECFGLASATATFLRQNDVLPRDEYLVISK